MSPITVNFRGICTHVTVDAQQRIVLVHAEDGAFINGAKIPPHRPLLKIDPRDIVGTDGPLYGLQATAQDGVWILRGAQLEILGGLDLVYASDASFKDTVPHLTALTHDAPLLSDDIVRNGNAACYFNVNGGKITATRQPRGAVTTQLTVDTNDKPALSVLCFWNRETHQIFLKPGATISIEHDGNQLGDTDQDFLLHYRVLTAIPKDAGVPKDPKVPPRLEGEIFFDISAGCSNSQYP
jgi:hypothetical protein